MSRLECSSVSYDMQLLLDVNTDIYPVELGDKLTVALAKSLTDNEMDDGIFDQSGRASLADEYEYVMYGKVFKCLEDKGSKVYALRRACAVCAVCVVCVCRVCVVCVVSCDQPTARVKWTPGRRSCRSAGC